MSIRDTVIDYRQAGLCVLPAILAQKRPAVSSWKVFQTRMPTEIEVSRWFEQDQAVCLICGAISGNLEMLDFDLGGEAFQAWYDAVERADPDLLSRLVIEQSPSGGWHVAYRCQAPVCGNMKLAHRRQIVDGPDEVAIGGKSYRPRQDADGQWYVLLTLIETRGEGGLFLCAPTPGYELLQGDFAELPVLDESQRDLLLEAAWSLNEHVPEPVNQSGSTSESADGRPGDDFNERGDVRAVLRRHGWTLVKGGDNEYWRRPGKTSVWSATLKEGVLFVFSSSAAPFEPQQAYSPFSVYALLEHGGDFVGAASALRGQGFGGDDTRNDVDISHIVGPSGATGEREASDSPHDPGRIPKELLRVPGFVSEVIDLCLETSPYPNQAMTFCGALALQAFLAGRKVRDAGDNRTNIYLLGLAHSSAGKDWIRKLNAKIFHEIGLSPCLGDRLASGEGIQDVLFSQPCMLFQTDEIDGMLQSINKARDSRHESIMNTLLSLFSSANSVFPMRPKAGNPNAGAIDQPNLVLFGTAIPNHYYEALSERMLTNGFFARMLIVEAGKRRDGQEPGIIRVSKRVLETAKWWADYRPGTGNLHNWHPVPTVVEHTERARDLLIESRKEAEAEYAKAEEQSDVVGTTVWGRVSEQARKLALLYAVSEDHRSPRIDVAAVEWASRFVVHQTQRMLFMAAQHVAQNQFHAECLKLLRRLQEAPDQQMQRQHLLRAMRCKAADFDQIVSTLIQQGDIVPLEIHTRTKGATGYGLP